MMAATYNLKTRKSAINAYRQIKKILIYYLPKQYNPKVYLGGSIAKKTSVNNDEIDIFIKSTNYLATFCSLLNLPLKYTIHDSITKYIHLVYNDIAVDIVPVCSPKENNSSYYSIQHVPYVIKNLKYPSEVIKFKKWAIKKCLYHSVIENSLSGYICQLLLIKFTRFQYMKQNVHEVIDYLKTVCDPVANSRKLYASISPVNLCRLQYLLKYNTLNEWWNIVNPSVIKVSKKVYREKFSRFIKIMFEQGSQVIHILSKSTYVYILHIYDNKKFRCTIKLSKPLPETADIASILRKNYLSFDQGVVYNKIVTINLDHIFNYSIDISKQQYEWIKNVSNNYFLTDIRA